MAKKKPTSPRRKKNIPPKKKPGIARKKTTPKGRQRLPSSRSQLIIFRERSVIVATTVTNPLPVIPDGGTAKDLEQDAAAKETRAAVRDLKDMLETVMAEMRKDDMTQLNTEKIILSLKEAVRSLVERAQSMERKIDGIEAAMATVRVAQDQTDQGLRHHLASVAKIRKEGADAFKEFVDARKTKRSLLPDHDQPQAVPAA